MNTCRDCGLEVSRSAKACPKCGARSPAVSSVTYNLLVGLAVAFTVFMFCLIWSAMG